MKHSDTLRFRASADVEDLYTQLEQIVSDGIWQWDWQSGETHVSTRFKQLLGYDADWSPDRPSLVRLLHADDRQAVLEMVTPQPEGNAPRLIEFRMRHRDGTYRYLECRWKSLCDRGNAPPSIIGAVRDVTTERNAQQNLERTLGQLRLTVNNAPVILFAIDAAGVFTLSEGKGLQVLGVRPGELVGASAFEVYADVPLALASLRRALRGETVTAVIESRGLAFEALYAPICADNGTVVGVTGIAFDVTERRQAEAALRLSEQRLREAQTLARIGSWDLDLVTGHLEWSDEIYRVFEIEQTRFGASYDAFLDAVHPDDRDVVHQAYTESVRDGRPYEVTHRLRCPDGRIKFVRERATTDYSAAGVPLRSRGTAQDVTEEMLAEDLLRRTLHERETLLRELHHRVKNNLQTILGLLHLHGKKTDDDAARASFHDLRQRLRAMFLIHDRLYRPGHIDEVDFSQYLRALVDDQVSAAQTAGRRVAITVDAPSLTLPFERALPCGMIVTELVSNALKHAFPGDRSGALAVGLEAVPHALILRVGDDGVGLPPDFDPGHSGSFGWQLARNLASQVGGTLAVDRSRGTNVVLRLPLP